MPRMPSVIFRWPVEDTGRNSVRPSTMPRTTASTTPMLALTDADSSGAFGRDGDGVGSMPAPDERNADGGSRDGDRGGRDGSRRGGGQDPKENLRKIRCENI